MCRVYCTGKIGVKLRDKKCTGHKRAKLWTRVINYSNTTGSKFERCDF